MSRDLSEKGWVPLRYWVVWWTLLGAAVVVFYVLLTPLWLGLRAAAWVAELRSRARRAEHRQVTPRTRRRQKGLCALCERPIERGDGIRRIRLPRHDEQLTVHVRCHDRDWEAVESGLEVFPAPAARPQAPQ